MAWSVFWSLTCCTQFFRCVRQPNYILKLESEGCAVVRKMVRDSGGEVGRELKHKNGFAHNSLRLSTTRVRFMADTIPVRHFIKSIFWSTNNSKCYGLCHIPVLVVINGDTAEANNICLISETPQPLISYCAKDKGDATPCCWGDTAVTPGVLANCLCLLTFHLGLSDTHFGC